MFTPPRSRRSSRTALAIALGSLGVAILAGVQALAHHPGSHAERLPDGRVRVDVTATVPDTCTRIASVQAGLPEGVRAVAGTLPVTIRLARPADAVCATQVRALREQAVLAMPSGNMLMLYVVGQDGAVAGSERVPIRS